jgi:ribonuclease III
MTDYHQFKNLEESICYCFRNKNLLLESMSHPSLRGHNHHKGLDYERLEFLGDTILNFIITEMLFLNFKNYSEGQLAKIRSYLICTEMLCNIAHDLDLSKYIIMTSGEENAGGRGNPSNLENAIEALIAAIYLDGDIEQIKNIITKLWSKYLDNMGESSQHDPKTYLQEWCQSQGYGVPIYEVIEKIGSAHEPLFTIKVTAGNHHETAQGKSIKLAQKNAAKKLLNLIEG